LGIKGAGKKTKAELVDALTAFAVEIDQPEPLTDVATEP
jgi:hypothetical protein